MNISSVLDFHSLLLRRNKPPKLLLHVVFGNEEVFPDPRLNRVILGVLTWRVGSEPHTAELLVPSLETG